MVFTGTYQHTIDAKNRLAIPANIRSRVARKAKDKDDPVIWYVTLGEGQALCLYTEDGFEQRADELDRSELDADELLEYEQLMYSLSEQVEMDKAGRVRLPERLLHMAELGTDVVLIGVKDHLEIRDRRGWQQHVKDLLDRRPNILMNPRRAMRKPVGQAKEGHGGAREGAAAGK